MSVYVISDFSQVSLNSTELRGEKAVDNNCNTKNTTKVNFLFVCLLTKMKMNFLFVCLLSVDEDEDEDEDFCLLVCLFACCAF